MNTNYWVLRADHRAFSTERWVWSEGGVAMVHRLSATCMQSIALWACSGTCVQFCISLMTRFSIVWVLRVDWGSLEVMIDWGSTEDRLSVRVDWGSIDSESVECKDRLRTDWGSYIIFSIVCTRRIDWVCRRCFQANRGHAYLLRGFPHNNYTRTIRRFSLGFSIQQPYNNHTTTHTTTHTTSHIPSGIFIFARSASLKENYI